MTTSKKPFARRLRELREAAGVSVAELAERTGLSRAALYNLENGAAPSWETVQLIARALSVPTDHFRDQ